MQRERAHQLGQRAAGEEVARAAVHGARQAAQRARHLVQRVRALLAQRARALRFLRDRQRSWNDNVVMETVKDYEIIMKL